MKAKTLRLRMTAGLLGCAVALTLAGTAAAQPVKTATFPESSVCVVSQLSSPAVTEMVRL